MKHIFKKLINMYNRLAKLERKWFDQYSKLNVVVLTTKMNFS